jgi:hypothetical protein
MEGGGGHIGEPVKSPLLLAGQCVHSEPTRGNLMAGEARTRTSYHSSGVALIASRHPPLHCMALVAASSDKQKQQHHHQQLTNGSTFLKIFTYVSQQLGLTVEDGA